MEDAWRSQSHSIRFETKGDNHTGIASGLTQSGVRMSHDVAPASDRNAFEGEESIERALVAEVARRGLSAPGDIVFVSGSVNEGLSNRLSDLDVFVITPRPLSGQLGGRSDGFEFNGRFVDPQMITQSEVEALTRRLEALPPRGSGT